VKTNKFHGQRNPHPTRAVHAPQAAEAGQLTQPAPGDAQGAPQPPASSPAAGGAGRRARPEAPLCAGHPLCASAGRWRRRTAQAAAAAPLRSALQPPKGPGSSSGRLPRPALRSGHFLAIKIVSIALSLRIFFFIPPQGLYYIFYFFSSVKKSACCKAPETPGNSRAEMNMDENLYYPRHQLSAGCL